MGITLHRVAHLVICSSRGTRKEARLLTQSQCVGSGGNLKEGQALSFVRWDVAATQVATGATSQSSRIGRSTCPCPLTVVADAIGVEAANS